MPWQPQITAALCASQEKSCPLRLARCRWQDHELADYMESLHSLVTGEIAPFIAPRNRLGQVELLDPGVAAEEGSLRDAALHGACAAPAAGRDAGRAGSSEPAEHCGSPVERSGPGPPPAQLRRPSGLRRLTSLGTDRLRRWVTCQPGMEMAEMEASPGSAIYDPSVLAKALSADKAAELHDLGEIHLYCLVPECTALPCKLTD